jgi:PAS domain S-box-containing protein
MRLNISTKLILSFLLMALLVGIAGFFTMLSNKEVIRSFTKGETHFRSIVEALTEAGSYAKRAEGHLLLYLSLHDKTDKEKFFTRCKSLDEQIVILDKNIQFAEARVMLDKIKTQAEQVLPQGKSLIEAHDKDRENTGRFELEKYAEPIRKLCNTTASIREQSVGLTKLELELESNVKGSAIKYADTIQSHIIIITLFSFIIALIIGYFIARNISRPITRIKNMAEEIGRGKLNGKVEIESKDEIGILADSFNRMIADLQKARNELVSAKEYTDNIVKSLVNALIVVNAEGNIESANQAIMDLLGYEKQEIIGQPFQMLFEDSELAKNLLGKLLKEGVIRNHEVTYRAKDQKKIPVSFSCSSIKDGENKIIRFVCIAHDMREIKQLQEQLIQSSKMTAIGTMAGGIAHDFNNLLFVIQGNIELLKSELPESAKELHTLVDNIKSSVTRGAELSKKLLTFARKEQYRLDPTNINQGVRNVVGLLERTVEKMINIETYFEPDLGVVMADASQIHQAVLNLCINAKDAMPLKGKLTIETRNVVLDEHYTSTHLDARPGRFVMISISDTGIGMDKETCSHLFEPFFTTKERGKGVGLGLPVTYGIIKAHNGFINVYSEKGKGTCFKIYLPFSEEKVAEKSIIKDEEIFEKGTGTILLADDEVPVQVLGKRILEKYGYTVLVANNGKEVLEIYQQRKEEIVLVILDYIMPGWSGKETFDELRKINPDINVLIATGYSLNSHGENLIQEGVKGFIQKPFSMKELLEEIKKIISEK